MLPSRCVSHPLHRLPAPIVPAECECPPESTAVDCAGTLPHTRPARAGTNPAPSGPGIPENYEEYGRRAPFPPISSRDGAGRPGRFHTDEPPRLRVRPGARDGLLPPPDRAWLDLRAVACRAGAPG